MAQHVDETELPMPSNLLEVEQLVQELYRPNPPQKLARIQATLQKLQRSSDGWRLASLLLEVPEEKIQFFGALTFTIKINSDSASLDQSEAEDLLRKLLGWLTGYTMGMRTSLVGKKLCSTLVVYFLQFPASWGRCVADLTSCLASGKSHLAGQKNESLAYQDILKMNPQALQASLWFCTMLAEEVGKTDANNIRHHKFHQHMLANVEDVVVLIAAGFASTDGAESTHVLCQEAINCFHAWVMYSHRALIDGNFKFESLKSLTQPAMRCLIQDDLYGPTMELFCEVLSNYSSFLRKDDLTMLAGLFAGDWAWSKHQALVQGDYDFQSLQFGQFMLAYGDAIVQNLARQTDNTSQKLLEALTALLNAQGFAVQEDLIFVQALEFWATFVEVLIDSLYSEEGAEAYRDEPSASLGLHTSQGNWFTVAKGHITNVIGHCWRKIQYPDVRLYETWDSSDKAGFSDARKDVADLLQSCYTLMGKSLFSTFVSLATRAASIASWSELEASFYCLGALADCINEDECDSTLAEIFGSRVFDVLADPAFGIPFRTRQSALSLIGLYDTYFVRHTEHLPSALNFLFRAVVFPELATAASKSINSLCSSCRQFLGGDIHTFLQQYTALCDGAPVDNLVKERVVGGVAAIIQADKSSATQLELLSHLLELSNREFLICQDWLSRGDTLQAEEKGVDILRCLLSLAKGMQAPPDIPVDLESSPTHASDPTVSFWLEGPGQSFTEQTLDLVTRIVELFSRVSGVIDAVCDIFRAGFTETTPGPFVFPAHAVLDFAISTPSDLSHLGGVVSMAASFVISRSSETDAIYRLFEWSLGTLRRCGEPSEDPEIAQAVIEFLSRLIPKHLDIILAQPSTSLELLFMFCLQALNGRDPLPKYASAEFWSTFLSSQTDQRTQQAYVGALQHMGPLIARALIYNISGHAARSDLDKLCEPLKKLITRQISSKSWLEAALQQVQPVGRVPEDADKRVLLQKLMSLRGSKQSNVVVKDYWLMCRGSNFAYVS